MTDIASQMGDLTNYFEVGKSYLVKPCDEIYPILDSDGNDTGTEETIVSRSYKFKVLGFPQYREGFIDVLNLESNRQQLFYMARTEHAEQLISTG